MATSFVVILCSMLATLMKNVYTYTPTHPIEGATDNGCLFKLRDSYGRPTTAFGFHLWGNDSERGVAHGYLLATQIIDWLEFYLIQTIFKNSSSSYHIFFEFVKVNITIPNEFDTEIDGIIQGMINSKKSLNVPSLGRNITKYDIIAMNSYLEVTAMEPGPWLIAPSELNTGCTQFVATYDFTDNRHLLTGRNMDGECDKSKVTVTHLIVFGIESPTTPRIISFLWPGFVGSLSAMNENGVYVMQNTGNMNRKTPVIGDITPISIIARSIVNNVLNTNFSSGLVQQYVIDNFASSQSVTHQGASGGGAILVCACDQPYDNYNESETMFILEMDRVHTMIRKPMESPDLYIKNAIMTSNHFRKYGVNITANNPVSQNEYEVFGIDVRTGYFNSSWRYETGREKLYAYQRTVGYLSVDAMQDVLRSVSHGYSEHSIITQTTGSIQFWFAVANPNSTQWDAPYETWYHFVFESVFTHWNITNKTEDIHK